MYVYQCLLENNKNSISEIELEDNKLPKISKDNFTQLAVNA